ncbi:MAG: isoprenyl transferase [Muribaculaceae bacterium]|nr:isoprenyl transferase [Muribaculaceae bacterium]
MDTIISELKTGNIPEHVAIIMDGNGRWAQKQGLDRSAGHVRGVDTVRQITEIASQLGVKYLTLYAFSTENWNRPQQEVDTLMNLIATAIERETPDLIRNNVRLALIGDTSRMPQFAIECLDRCIADTSRSTGLTLCLAISYSSRWELTDTMRRIAVKVKEGTLEPEQITDRTIKENLVTSFMPDPDLLIRTGGDLRVSNFLLWQIAYSEIYVTDTFWPVFSKLDFCNAVAHFQKRERRFGLTGEQVRKS